MAVGLTGVLLALGTVSPAHALRQHLELEQLCEMASLIVVGEVTTAQSQWAAGPRAAIETVVDVAVDTVIKGTPVDSLTVVTMGGAVGELQMTIESAAKLSEAHVYGLLLVQRDQHLVVVGGSAGVFELPPGDTQGTALLQRRCGHE